MHYVSFSLHTRWFFRLSILIILPLTTSALGESRVRIKKRGYPMADGPSAKATQQSSQGTVLGQGGLPQRTGSTGDEACDASSK